MIKGADLSHNNDINWSNMSPDIKFIFHKASQGISFHDPAFNSRWQYLKTTQLFRGAYHFLTATGTAQQQAENFLSRGVNFKDPLCLPPMLDIEDQVPASLNANITKNKAAFIQLATDWIDIVSEATGRKVLIYSYKNFFRDYLNNHVFPNTYLWLAAYQTGEPGLPVGYNSYQFWQYSERGRISGEPTGGEIDLDYFNGTLEELGKL